MKRLVPLLLALLAVVVVACSTNEPAAPDITPVEITLIATDIVYDQTALEGQAGRPIRLTLVNEGALEHDFSIMEIPHSGEVMAEEMEQEMEHDMSEMALEPEVHIVTPSGGSATVEFTPSTPGTYEYYCTVAGHKEAGMAGTLTVTAP